MDVGELEYTNTVYRNENAIDRKILSMHDAAVRGEHRLPDVSCPACPQKAKLNRLNMLIRAGESLSSEGFDARPTDPTNIPNVEIVCNADFQSGFGTLPSVMHVYDS